MTEAVTTGTSRAAGAVGDARSGGTERAPGAEDARAHPLLIGAFALAAGVAAGLAIPSTATGECAPKPLADDARDAASRYANGEQLTG